MRKIEVRDIIEKVKDSCMSANFDLGEDILSAFEKARDTEESPVGEEILEQLIENAKIAKEEKVALCQDTGFAVFFVESLKQTPCTLPVIVIL